MAAKAMESGEAPRLMQEDNQLETEAHEFNLGLLVCLGKKASMHSAETGYAFKTENTRPLSIVNTDNRLMANSYRLKLDEFFKK